MAGPLDKLTKLDGRLRCVANGRTEVNSVRAQQNGAVRIRPDSKAAARVPPELAEAGPKSLGLSLRGFARGKSQDRLPSDVEVNVFVLFNRLDDEIPKAVSRRNGRVGVATVTLAGLKELDKDPAIQAIELAETLKAPRPDLSTDIPQSAPAPRFERLNSGALDLGGGRTAVLDAVGENVLVGIIDVGGIDFAHPDFLDDKGVSRVIAIWDQGGDAFDPPKLPVAQGKAGTSDGYGSERPTTLPRSRSGSGARTQPMSQASPQAVPASASARRLPPSSSASPTAISTAARASTTPRGWSTGLPI
jgi:hypothetical protein